MTPVPKTLQNSYFKALIVKPDEKQSASHKALPTVTRSRRAGPGAWRDRALVRATGQG